MTMMGFPLLKWIIVCTNWLIFTFLIILMCEHHYAGNSLKSWSFVFYVLSFWWLTLKGIFWLLTALAGRNWGAFEFYVLYWVPVPLEICTFMLVPLFFVNMVYPRRWKYYKIYIRPVYITITCGLTVLTVMWSLLAAVSLESQHKCMVNFLNEHDKYHGTKQCFRTEYTGDIFRFITASCFLFLSFTQGWFGVKLHRVTDWQQLGMLATQKESLTRLNVFLCFSFFSRVVYQILAIFWDFRFANIPLDGAKDVQVTLFLVIMLWDYLPAVLLLLFVVSPSLQGGIFASRARSRSRAFSVDEPEPFSGRRRTDTDVSDIEVEGGGMWAQVWRTIATVRARVTGGEVEEINGEKGIVRLNYGTDSVLYGDSFKSNPLKDPPHPQETASLLGLGRLSGTDRGSSLHSAPPVDPSQRFQQAPLLPRAPSTSFRGPLPYHQVSTDRRSGQQLRHDPVLNFQQNQQPMHRQQSTQVFAPPQDLWGCNNSDANFDPDLYAYSAIPQTHGSSNVECALVGLSGTSHGSKGEGFSPLDLQLQRDTSAHKHKFASYAPHAPPAPLGSATTPLGGSNGSKFGNPPSALENALGAWKKNPTHLRVVSQHHGEATGLDRLMSPSAMSQNSPCDSPSDFSLFEGAGTLPSSIGAGSSRPPMHLSSGSSAGRSATNLHLHHLQNGSGSCSGSGSGSERSRGSGSTNLHRAQRPQHQEISRHDHLSSRPMLRNSSGNFLNLATLAQDDHLSDKRLAAKNGSDCGSKSTQSTDDSH